MRTISKRILTTALFGLSFSLATTGAFATPYTEDPQAQYPKDQTQDTFQMASMVACVIRSFAPEQNVGVGQYLAYWDDNKCNDSGSGVPTSTGSGGTSQAPAKLGQALVTVTQTSAGALKVDALLKITDEENGINVTKDIQVMATIYGGANIAPPYGNWSMDFCSSTVGSEGSCNDGMGYLRVDSNGISVYNKWSKGYRTGKSVFTGPNGTTGYGAAYSRDDQWTDGNSNALFAFSPGVYKLKDRQNSQEFCFNPSINASGVRYSTWENFLYDRNAGTRVTYENPGFYLSSNLSGQRIGDVTSWGVNFWNEADAADKIDGAVLLRANDTSQSFTLKKAPGRLQKVSTSITAGLEGINGIPLNINFWGYDRTYNGGVGRSVGAKELLADLDGISTNSNSLSIAATWNGSSFVFTDYQDCSSGNCLVIPLSASKTRTLAQLYTFGFNNLNGWVNGVNVSYNVNLSAWNNSTNQQEAIPLADLKLIKRTSEVVAPTDTTVPTNMACIGNCPSVDNGALSDARDPNMKWPPLRTSKTNVIWDRSLGAPTVSGGGVTKAIDFRVSGNPNNGHWYELYDAADLTAMECSSYAGPAYCTEKITQQASSTYYTWQTGNRWDSYDYLVYRSGSNAGTAVAPNPPLNLSYVVADAQGTDRGYVGKTITIQSPQPGNIWLPGYCVDKNLVQKPCSGDTDWVNAVSIPTAANDAGTVTLLNRAGTATSTKYYAKWLKRGVYFESISASNCSSLGGGITQAESLSLPGLADYDTGVKTLGLPWPSSSFNGNPRVIDGILQ
jgi:hypothetical protein